MTEIKLITKDTNISDLNIKIIDWDIVIKGVPYYVAHIYGYVHSIGGRWGDNDMWAFPRNETPSYENLVEFSPSSIVNWGLSYKENYYFKTKYDETEVRESHGTMITRNDEDFYFVPGGMDYSLAKARYLLTKVQEGPFGVYEIDYDKKFDGKIIVYKRIPAVIERYIKGQGCIIISYYGDKKYENLVRDIWNIDDSDLTVKLDIIGYDHQDINWFPEYNDIYNKFNLLQLIDSIDQ